MTNERQGAQASRQLVRMHPIPMDSPLCNAVLPVLLEASAPDAGACLLRSLHALHALLTQGSRESAVLLKVSFISSDQRGRMKPNSPFADIVIATDESHSRISVPMMDIALSALLFAISSLANAANTPQEIRDKPLISPFPQCRRIGVAVECTLADALRLWSLIASLPLQEPSKPWLSGMPEWVGVRARLEMRGALVALAMQPVAT